MADDVLEVGYYIYLPCTEPTFISAPAPTIALDTAPVVAPAELPALDANQVHQEAKQPEPAPAKFQPWRDIYPAQPRIGGYILICPGCKTDVAGMQGLEVHRKHCPVAKVQVFNEEAMAIMKSCSAH